MRVRDFLRVGCQHRPAKSRKGHRRTPERRSVLHGQLAKVERRETVRKFPKGAKPAPVGRQMRTKKALFGRLAASEIHDREIL